ncbi:MAG: energy transducer TonB [Planctomycetaceae bacterium]|nr:energy transducer TonB [Planctomycetaceae bacterium]
MTSFNLWLSRLNGWVLSLILHGLVGGLAALSVFGVSASGGSGWGSGGGAAGGGGAPDSYEAGLQHEDLVSGEPLGDPVQYGHLTEEAPEPSNQEVSAPTIPFDVFAVGAADVLPPPTPPVVSDPLTARPAPAADRGAKLPSGSDKEGPGTEEDSPAGNAEAAGSGGPGGSGGGNTGGEGKGQGTGTGDGNATEVYTPAPAYPSDARRRNIQGVVLVELAIGEDGSCKFEKIVESSGCDSLDNAVAATVSRWKYRNAAADGRPPVMTKRVRFVFRLNDNR